jgi:geranylgeranyl reductase family protein
MRGLSGTESCDVLVLGLGPAGAAAACAAARAGARVIAVDRKAEAGVPVQCAEFVPALIGQEAGDIAAARRQAITEMVTFVEDETGDTTPDFRGTMISRADFDRLMVDKAMAAGAACHFASPVRSIAADGRARLASGAEIAARVLIGADGPHSLAGKAIGAVNRVLIESRQVTVPLLTPHGATDIFLSADIPGGYGWLFPRGDVANVGVGVEAAAKQRLKPLLLALHDRLAREGRVGREVMALTGGPIPAGGMVGPAGSTGATPLLLAGDAAGLANPVTGAGISAAVTSGAMAGRAAAAICAGTPGAANQYRDDLEDLFGPPLARALARRAELLAHYHNGQQPDRMALRNGWIAYPQYWAA